MSQIPFCALYENEMKKKNHLNHKDQLQGYVQEKKSSQII